MKVSESVSVIVCVRECECECELSVKSNVNVNWDALYPPDYQSTLYKKYSLLYFSRVVLY